MTSLRGALPLLCFALAACGGGGVVQTRPPDGGQDGGDGGADAGDGGLDTGDAGPCPTDPAPSQPAAATVTAGAATRFLLKGRVVTPDTVIEPGQVLVSADRIACVGADCSGDAAAAGATVIETRGVIFPGLVDAHNHTQYNYLPPWAPSPPQLFQNRGQWAARADYSAWTASVNDNEATYLCEQVKYGELRALVGGATTMQGTYGTPRNCFKTLVHNAEFGNELGADLMRTNIPGIDSVDAAGAASLRADMLAKKVTAYVIHLAEGIDQKSKNEFASLKTKGLLLEPTVIIHGTALGAAEFAEMAAAKAKLVWSPLSNLQLYGATTDVKAALAQGLNVSIAPDWTLSGSPSMLAELRVARHVACTDWQGLLGAKQLTLMATSNPADALGLASAVGRLAPGLLADVLVVADRGQEAYRTLVEARPQDLRLVMIGGNVRYGDADLIAALGRASCESLQMCGLEKRICVADSASATDKLNQSLAQIIQAVGSFYANPYRLDVCE